jgi:hypothetical protein
MIDDHFLDHLADRHGLASPALDVAGKKPVETVFRIVRALLLRQQEHEAVAIGERRPAGAEIVTRRRLRTTVHLHPNSFSPYPSNKGLGVTSNKGLGVT